MPKPNIIFFFSDQQRWDTLGCYGQPLDITPNLDQLAAEGVRFELAFTCQPVCGPARSALQTGKYPTEVGCFRNDIALPVGEKTIAQHLSAAGYEVGYLGKWHLASSGESQNYRTRAVPPEYRGGYKDFWLASDVLEFTSHGYDGHLFNAEMEQVDFKGYRVDCLTDFALDYLRTRTREKPFFLFLSFIEPHHQNDHHCYEGPIGSKEKYKNFIVPGDLVGTVGDWRVNYPDYLGCINSLDTNLGRLRNELKKLGLAENTIIIYTSDHGSHFKTRNSEYKRACHDACTRIPLIIHGPGFESGQVIPEMVSLIDLPPTLLKIAGLEKPPEMRGNPLQDLISGANRHWPKEVFIQISESQVGRAVRTRKWKYSVSAPGKNGSQFGSSNFYKEEYLYDLENDPHERDNRVGAPELEEIRNQLAAILKKKMAEAGEVVPDIYPISWQPPK